MFQSGYRPLYGRRYRNIPSPEGYYKPGTAAQFAAATGITPTSLYLFQETVGNTLVDALGAANLSDSSASALYRQNVGSRFGITYPVAGSRHDGNVHGLGVTSGIYMVTFIPPASNAALNGTVGRLSDGAGEGLYSYIHTAGSGRLDVTIADTGVNVLTLSSPTSIRGFQIPLHLVIQVDRAANRLRVRLVGGGKLIWATEGDITGFATLNGGANQLFGFGGYKAGVSIGGNGIKHCYGMVATGAQCEGAEVPRRILRGLGME